MIQHIISIVATILGYEFARLIWRKAELPHSWKCPVIGCTFKTWSNRKDALTEIRESHESYHEMRRR